MQAFRRTVHPPHFLILHGQSDANVTANSALDLAAELQVLEIPYRLVLYENGTHALFEYKQQVITELLNWFEDKLDHQNEGQRDTLSQMTEPIASMITCLRMQGRLFEHQ